MGRGILSIISSQTNLQCLPCDRVNLDTERFAEYRDSDEHPAQAPFEQPPLVTKRRLIAEVGHDIPTILRYFLDGSRKTYKVADVIVDGRYLPLIAGQVGVCVMKRDDDGERLAPLREFTSFANVMAFPDRVAKEDLEQLQARVNEKTGLAFTFFSYNMNPGADPVDLGIAKIMSEMQDKEISTVLSMAARHMLSNDQLLVIDGPLRFRKRFDLVQFRNVIGLSKTFRPSFTLGKGRHREDVGLITSRLGYAERTSAYKTLEEEKVIGMWYLRIRRREFMANALEGIVKMENYAIEPEEKEMGISADRIDSISAYLLRERNVSPFKSDSRWASHIYPIYMAETYLKRSFMSDVKFHALF